MPRTFLSFCFRDVIGLPMKLRLVVCDMLLGEAHPATRHVRHDIRASRRFLHHKSGVLMMNRLIDCRSERGGGAHDQRWHAEPATGNKSLVLDFLSIDLRMGTRRMDGLVMLDEF